MKSFLKSNYKTLCFVDKDSHFRSILCFVEAELSTLQQKAKHFLHPQEFSFLEGVPSDKRKRSYLLGRYAAKQALAQHNASISPTDILIKSGVFQQPIVYFLGEERLQITLSHCDQGGIALTFPETHPMGIDIEVISSNYNEAIETHLTFQEKNILKAVSDSSVDKSYMVFWTVKEALSKALRTGFMSPLEIYEIETIELEADYWISEFKNFSQYQGRSFFLGNLICSLVYPKNIHLKVSNPLIGIAMNDSMDHEKAFFFEQRIGVAQPISRNLLVKK